jgi:hypothetical protein
MNPLLNRLRTSPSGQLPPSFAAEVTSRFDGSTSGGGLSALSTGCRAWAMRTDVEKDAAIRAYADSKGVPASQQTAARIQTVLDLISNACAAVHRPTIADTGLSCEAWSALATADKLARIRTLYGPAMNVWVNEYDVAGVAADIASECFRGGLSTVLRVIIQAPPTGLPSDLSVALNGVAMPRVAAADGTMAFESRGVAAGASRVSVHGSRIISSEQSVDVVSGTTTTVPIVANPERASVRVAVSVPVGVAMSDVIVTGIPGLIRASDGSFTATGVPPQSIPYDVVASAPGMEQQHQSIVIRPGDSASLSFSLQPSVSSVSVTVVLAGSLSPGTPAPTPAVRVNGTPAVRTTAGGPFVVSGLAPGSYTVEASAAGYESATQTLTVAAGASASARFELRPSTGSIKVVATAVSGALPATIGIAGDSGGATQVPSAMAYYLSGITAGQHTITVTADGFQPLSQPVTIFAGQETNVQAALQPLLTTSQADTGTPGTGNAPNGTGTGTGITPTGMEPQTYSLCPTPPTFTDPAARSAWIQQYGMCPPPAEIVTATATGLSRNAKIGISVAVVALAGVATYFVARKRRG